MCRRHRPAPLLSTPCVPLQSNPCPPCPATQSPHSLLPLSSARPELQRQGQHELRSGVSRQGRRGGRRPENEAGARHSKALGA